MSDDALTLRALILAPTGRDAWAIGDLLTKAGITARTCNSISTLVAEMECGVGMVTITEEALDASAISALAQFVMAQPPWSDLPFVVLSSKTMHPQIATWRARMMASLQNVSLLERPVQAITIVSAVQSALRARRRQYEAREYFAWKDRAADQLERLVMERTQKLHEANTALQQQMAERQEIEERLRRAQRLEAIGQLTGGIAHDFNNLLMVISSGLSMLEKRPDKRLEIAESMKKATGQGARLTHQLLAFSRRQSLKPESIDLGLHFGEMAELLDRSLRGDVHVVTELAPDLWPVEADPDELRLVILNLAVNARDAMPHGGVIRITACNAPANADSKDLVEISVIDTGIGMPPEIIDKVFEPFFTTKEVGKGSGLGLAQVHGFVNQSGGTTEITSAPGKGTTVTLKLPRSAHQPAKKSLPVQDTGINPHSAEGSVLVVEDDGEVATLVAEMFREIGYDVTRAASADAALGALANGRHIDFVFSDVMMPGGMNGLELCREIRRRHPDMPVLLTSGYPDVMGSEAQREGVRLLAKPYHLEALRAAVFDLKPAHVVAEPFGRAAMR